jgi:7-keto-8-aminopelargonate synthetase-like enzyme
MDKKLLNALLHNPIEYYSLRGIKNDERCKPLDEYGKLRSEHGINTYSNCVMHSPIGPYVDASIGGKKVERYLNFSSQDYTGLSQHPAVRQAVKDVVDELGIHTASSPAFTGRNTKIVELEEKLANVLGMDQAILFTAGWMACFGAVSSLVSKNDIIFLDGYAHNSLQTAAQSATNNIYKFKHNDLNHLETLLKKQRQNNPKSGLFVVVESLYSMHADIIDLKTMLEIINRYDANLILDIAHDFGVYGKHGLGVLEDIPKNELENIVIIGAFSKAFATNGGFIAGKNIIRNRTMLFSPSYTFSNSITPMQTAAALKCAEILFSEQGNSIRKKIKENIDFAIKKFHENGFKTIGNPSPIIPVLIGDEKLARLMYKENINQHLLANLAEFPAVPKNQSLFRFQMMATHEPEHITTAIEKFRASKENAQKILDDLIK